MSRELHKERLATTDQEGKRLYLYPEKIQGEYKNRREIFYSFLIFLYLILPWTRVGGLQTLLIDIPKREFIFFGQIFYGHDAPLLFFLFAFIALFIAFITALWGRVWCGWACPQTVFIHAIFIKIDEFFEGDARERRELDRAPLSPSKILIKSLKWATYLIISLIISHSFVAYFLGSSHLWDAITSPPSENIGAFISMLITTAIILFDLGWFREQFCIIACPYGRFQSVLMDESSLVVLYDEKRGEPRRAPHIKTEDEGDCINCGLCVKVCPTGIDIRRGTQLECIACTLCMDGCDSIMTKLNRPKGLIRYGTEEESRPQRTEGIRLRTIIYLVLLFLVSLLLFINLINRPPLNIQLIRDKNSYTENGETILNYFQAEIIYQGASPKTKITALLDEPDGSTELTTPLNQFPIVRGKKVSLPLFIKFKATRTITIKFYDDSNEAKPVYKKITLIGPFTKDGIQK